MSRKKVHVPLVAALTATFLTLGTALAFASVSTDQADYSPGSVVTISGDNSNGAGYLDGETVAVSVSGPNGYTAWCEGQADVAGAWSCQVALWDNLDAVGDYTYTATGQTSGVSESGMFTDAVNINSFSPDCNTASDSVATGVNVCAKATGLGSSASGKIEWWAPGASSATRTTAFSGASGNATDSWVPAASPDACGTWTLKVYTGTTFQDDDTFAVTGCVTNSAPNAGTISGDSPVDEGSQHTYTSDASDPDSGDTLTYAWSVTSGNATINGSSTGSSVTLDFGDGFTGSTATLHLVVGDGHTGHDVSPTDKVITIDNVAPSGTFNTPSAHVTEGSSFSLSITGVTDPVDTTFTYRFDCGAGYGSWGSSSSATCTTATDGPATLNVKGEVRDEDLTPTSGDLTGTVEVDNALPVVTASMNATPVDCRSNATLTWSFTDAGVNDGPWAVVIDWNDPNDATDTTFNAATQGSQTAETHTYNTPGTYSVDVSVTDKDGGTGTDNGNSITINQTYAVDFLPPFDDSSPSALIVNKMKNGRVVPVKATIYDECTLSYVTDPAAVVTLKVTKTTGTGTGDPIESYADAGESSAGTDMFRWSTDGFWIYNLDSKALGLVVNNLYRIDIKVGAVLATTDTWAVLQPVK